MHRPPSAVPVCVRSSSAGEHELQDWHSKRNHSHADNRAGGNDRGCGTLVPIVGLQNHDIGGRRQNSQDEEYLRVREQLVKVHARRIVCPVGERQHAEAVGAHEYDA